MKQIIDLEFVGSKALVVLVLYVFLSHTGQAQQIAFPGAEGFGMYTTGGRGGRVIKVTNLNDSGEGSFRAAVEATGPRMVVFEVSGTIALASTLTISNDDITIAGQTAPGDGICVRNYSVSISASNVVIRYLRFRLGDEAQQVDDAVRGRFQRNIIIDHCSMSWSTDECASFYANENFTMQWCLLTESLRNSIHYGAHGFGGIWGGNRASFHHNLLAHHSNRNPRFRGHKLNSTTDEEHVDLRNNVIYNYKGTCYGSEGGGRYNMVNNYFKRGPATGEPDKEILFVNAATAEYNWLELEGAHGSFYVSGNHISANETYTNDNWNGAVAWEQSTTIDRVKSETEFDKGNIRTDHPEIAYQRVLEYVGASLSRDTVDKRAIHDTRTGTVTVMDGGNGSTNGYIDTQEAVGGWPELKSLPAPTDTDEDGMPDDWELAKGLNPNDPDDGNEDRTNDGYTNIEEYINSLAFDYFDTEPVIKMLVPRKNQVFLDSTDAGIHVEAYSNDYNGGAVVKMELYLDDELVGEFSDSTRIITTLENVSPGMHHIAIKATDDSGKITVEKSTVFVGTKEVRINVDEAPNGRVVLEPSGGVYAEGVVVKATAIPIEGYLFNGWIEDIETTRNDLQITTANDLTIKPVFVKDLERKNKWSCPIKINFQPEEDYAIPDGYIPDYGGALREKWTGYTYGWHEGYHPFNGLNSGTSGAWRTFRYFESGGNKNSWGIELPKGIYRIRLGLGGKVLRGFPVEAELKINVEGIVVEDNDGVDLLDEHILDSIPVLDGQLTLTSVEQSRICFIEIELQQLVSPRTLTVENGSGDGDYYPAVDNAVMIMADTPSSDQVFEKWTGDTTYLEDVYSSTTFVTMPDTNVSITATYKAAPAQEAYYVSVIGGSGTGYYTVGTQLEISAPDTIIGGDFSHWEYDCLCTIDINEGNRRINFSTVAANVVFEPVYEMRALQTDNDVYQAEYADFDERSTDERYHGGYYGLGYVNFGNSTGSFVQFNSIDGKEGGLFAVKLRYALNDKNREGVIIVNGVQYTFTMAETKSWTDWVEVEVVVELEPGEQNTIRVETVGDDLGYFDQIEIIKLSTTGFEVEPIKPITNIVCYPNPFSDYTTISFELRSSSDVIIQIYNLQGQMVRQVCDSIFLPGVNEVKLNKENLTPGLYILMVNSKLSQQTLKVIID